MTTATSLPKKAQLKCSLCSYGKLGKMNPFWRKYFSDGLVQPPTRLKATSWPQAAGSNATTFRQSFRQNLLQAYSLSQKCRRLVSREEGRNRIPTKRIPGVFGWYDWRWLKMEISAFLIKGSYNSNQMSLPLSSADLSKGQRLILGIKKAIAQAFPLSNSASFTLELPFNRKREYLVKL